MKVKRGSVIDEPELVVPPEQVGVAGSAVDIHYERVKPYSRRCDIRVGRVARTIAALAESESVRSEHVAEALSYRSPDELASV